MTFDTEKLLDDTGWQILTSLQENARISFKELAQQIKLSPPAVAERIRRMEDAGIITGYRVELNLEKLGLPMTAFIQISSAGEKCIKFSKVITELPEVIECHRITGSDHFILKVVVSSATHLKTLLDRLVPYGQLTPSIVLSSPVNRRRIEQSITSP